MSDVTESINLSEYPEKYLDCRDQHVWKKRVYEGRVKGTVNVDRTCKSCGAKRFDVLTRVYGTLLSRRYDYSGAPGYLLGKKNNLRRVDYRLEFITRALGPEEKA